MSHPSTSMYDLASTPLVVGRVPSLPTAIAVEVLSAPDPVEATRRFYEHNAFARSAIAVASPSLARSLDGWIAGKPLRNAKTPLRALSYLLRMTTRPTPFGLFAGIGNVESGDRTTLELDDTSTARRSYTRPDMGLLRKCAEALEAGELRGRVAYCTNQCAFVRGDRLYVTNLALTRLWLDGTAALTEQREVSLKNTQAVVFVRALCHSATRYDDITAALSGRFEAPLDDSRRLLDRLIEAGVVISELQPSPLGDPATYLLERFEALDAPFGPALRAAAGAAAALDSAPLASRSGAQYLEVRERFSALLETPPPSVVQVDLRATFRGALGTAILDDAAILADSYVRMGRIVVLEKFRERFIARYEGTDRMVPLLELVDNDLGLGVLDATSVEPTESAERDAALLRIACDAMRSNREEIELTGELLVTFLPRFEEDDPIAPSLEVGFQIAARSCEDVENGDYLMVAGFVGDAATKTVGRFAHMLGEGFVRRAREVAQRTVAPGELVAEFAYAPAEPRAYNVSIRPLLFDCEVRAGIGAPRDADTVAPDDLWVGIEDNRFFLWSKSRARRVNIRETHALVTATSAPNLCRLLAMLHVDGRRFPQLDWGPAQNLAYLPRLRRGRVVLAPRRWRVPRAAFGKSASEAARELERWRSLWMPPRYVHLCTSDQRLLLDLDSPIAGALIDDQAPAGVVELSEALPEPDRMWVRGAFGAHAVEFVAQAVAARSLPAKRKAAAPTPIIVKDRIVHGPGSWWVYAKLYLGAQAMDNFLVSALVPLVNELRSHGEIDRWFFLRYEDPASHLRVRLHAADAERAPLVRARFLEAAEGWLCEFRLMRYALDTYEPEYERYGTGERLLGAERFFAFDSDLCAGVIAGGVADTEARIEAAAATFDALLRGSESLDRAVFDAYAAAANRKLAARDRESLRRISVTNTPPATQPGVLERALEGPGPEKRLTAFVHMHCNRLGLCAASEERVHVLLRSLAIARAARKEDRRLAGAVR